MKYYLFIALLLVFASCVETPNSPAIDDYFTGGNGLYVLCEGLWGADNSSLERVDLERGVISLAYYDKANPGLRLGDNANDLVFKGDTAFVSVSTSSVIEAFRKSDGKFVGRILLPQNSQPRTIVIVNDTLAYVALLYKKAIAKFNPTTMQLDDNLIEVGPFPEGMAYLAGKLFVANSGYGDYFHTQDKAGTISVVDINSQLEIKNLECGKNPIEVVSSSKYNKIYAAYYHLPSMTDSLGGIVEYDATSLIELRRWRLRATDLTLSNSQDTLYFIRGNTSNSEGVGYIVLSLDEPIPKLKIKNLDKNTIWYSLSQSPDNGLLLVGDAKRFQSRGELLIFSNRLDSIPLKKFQTGVNPSKIRFF